MTSRPCRLPAALMAALLALGARTALAVIVAGDYASVSDTDVNVMPPANDPGFYNVGSVGDASDIYIGNDWVLTAGHVTLGSTTSFTFPDPANPAQLDTATYNIVPNSGVTLTNPSGRFAGDNADLVMFKIDPTSSPYGSPNLRQPILANTAPTLDQTVIGIGRGVDRASSLTYWDNSMPTWNTTSEAQAVHTGYVTEGAQVLRWGNNQISQTTQDYNLGTASQPIYVQAFATTFEQVVPPAFHNEFQATVGDSGGAAFSDIGGIWMLSGMLDGISLLPGQPYPSPQTAAFGDQSIIADISLYRDQILAHDPLPGDANGDGIVNSQDIEVIASHWLQSGSSIPGDVNGDGIVNGQDLVVVASRWTIANATEGGALPDAAGSAATAVPEPATGVMAAIALLIVSVARRQQGRTAPWTYRFSDKGEINITHETRRCYCRD
jgi:hypothetical protein